MIPPPIAGADVVRFDETAARHLVAALEDLAATLRAALHGEVDRSAAVRRDWHGHSRSWFDQNHHDLLASLRGAVNACEQDAEEVRRSIARAAAIQDALNHEAQVAADAEAARQAELARTAPTN